jgi:hypothetical protein
MHAAGENLEPDVRRRSLYLPDYTECNLCDINLQHYIGRRDPSASCDKCLEVAHSNGKESGHQRFVWYRFNVSTALVTRTLDQRLTTPDSSACIASGMRAYYNMRIIHGGDKADISYESMFTAVWSWIECSLGVIVACTLSIPKLVQAKGGSVRTAISKATRKFGSLTSGRGSDQGIHESSSTVRLSSIDPQT